MPKGHENVSAEHKSPPVIAVGHVQPSVTTAQPGPLGGADNELGGEFRAELAGYVATFGLRGMEIRLGGDERVRGVPAVVRCEVDEAVDDLEVRFVDGRRVLVQVKRHLTFDFRAGRPLANVIDQWIDQCSGSTTELIPLVAVAESASERVRHLAAALDRRRDPYAGAPTNAEAKALADLSAALSYRKSGVVDSVLDRASIAVIDLSSDQGKAVPIGLLDGNVVANGQGQAAFGALAEAHRRRAARRTGLDLDGWVEVLRRAQLDVLADANGCRSARRAAELAALSRHLNRLIAEGQTVDLLALGTALPPIPTVPLTQVTRNPADNNQDRKSTDVDQAWRRHGRVLLLGQPGSGKSTMLRWLAAREAERGWSTPVLIDLRALLDPAGHGGRPLRLDSGTDPLDTLIELAVAAAPLDDRDLLTSAIRLAAAEGSLLICLDSLDETRDHRYVVVSWLRRLLDRVDVGCDFVLATRTSAYAEAATLGWSELWVSPPTTIEPIVSGVLEAFARRDARNNNWVRKRLRWAVDSASRAPRLADTPLLLTALAVEAAQRASLDEIVGPAQLLERITDWVASNWERRTDRIGLELPSGLHTARITEVLRTALARLAWDIVSNAGLPEVGAIQDELSARYQTEHGLAPGPARTLAESAVHFWDEAGIVVLDHYGRMAGRARPVIEVAAARYLETLPPTDRAVAVARFATDPTTFEVLSLLVSLDGVAAGEVIDVASAGRSRDLLFAVASGLRSSSGVSPAAIGRLVDALDAIPAAKEADQAMIIRYLVDLPPTLATRRQILSIIETKLSPAVTPVWVALAHHRWGDPAAAEACRAVTLAGPPGPPSLSRSSTGVMRFSRSGTDDAFSEVVLATARSLSVGDQDLAEHIRQVAYHHCSARTWGVIAEELGQRGFHNGLPTEQRWDITAYRTRFESFQTATIWLLEHLAKTDESHMLRVVEQRRLNNLSRLVQGLAIGKLELGVFEAAVQQHKDDVIAVTEVFLNQGGFDRKSLGAEAAAFLAEYRNDKSAWLYLTYDAPACNLSWQGINVSDVIEFAAHLLNCGYWLAYLALVILVDVPESDRPTASRAAAAKAEAGIPARQRSLAAFAALQTDPTRCIARWRNAADPVLVAAVMECATNDTDRLALLVEGLGHPDALVREEAADQLTIDDAAQPAIAEALRHALGQPNSGTCRYCGETFVKLNSNCERCGLALPDPSSKIDRLLRQAASETTVGGKEASR